MTLQLKFRLDDLKCGVNNLPIGVTPHRHTRETLNAEICIWFLNLTEHLIVPLKTTIQIIEDEVGSMTNYEK